MPQNPFMVATKSPFAEVYIFDITKHPSTPTHQTFSPQHVCCGHKKEGYGLCWNPRVTGYLLSGSDDAIICLWDISAAGAEVNALRKWEGHHDVIEDVSWHQHSPHIFGSVGDDCKVLVWDIRKPHVSEASIQVANAHKADINSISFNPFHEFLFVTGAADRDIKLWDIRNTSNPVHTLSDHDKQVFQVQWAQFDASILASCGADRRVRIWDLSRIGSKTLAADDSNAPSELLFIHGGHCSSVLEVNWNNFSNWLLCSVSDDNVVQIWKPRTTSSLS